MVDFALLKASAGGSVEVLAIAAAGAYLAHAGHFTPQVCQSISKAIFKLFLPSLVFVSILDTVYFVVESMQTIDSSNASLQDIWLPPVMAIIIHLVTALLSFPIIWIVARGKEEAVRRTAFLCLMLGNTNSMVLIIMKSLCDNYLPLQQGGRCFSQSAGFASLFTSVGTILSWTVFLQYLASSPDSASITHTTERLVPFKSASEMERNANSPKQKSESMWTVLARGLFTPPFIAVLVAATVAILPLLPQMLLRDAGMLRPLFLSIKVISNALVPLSGMIVGASLYRSIQADGIDSLKQYRPEEKFGIPLLVTICGCRLIVLPAIGRVLFRLFSGRQLLPNPVLSVFSLVEWTVPTANKMVVMLNLVNDSLPRIGEQLKNDVSKTIFIQFVTLPIFLTLNTALALQLQFP